MHKNNYHQHLVVCLQLIVKIQNNLREYCSLFRIILSSKNEGSSRLTNNIKQITATSNILANWQKLVYRSRSLLLILIFIYFICKLIFPLRLLLIFKFSYLCLLQEKLLDTQIQTISYVCISLEQLKYLFYSSLLKFISAILTEVDKYKCFFGGRIKCYHPNILIQVSWWGIFNFSYISFYTFESTTYYIFKM